MAKKKQPAAQPVPWVKETLEQYHSNDAVSSSRIKVALRSPEHYLESLRQTVRKETPAKRLGTLIHSAMLEPRRFLDNFIVAPDVDRRTKDGKEEWARFQDILTMNPERISVRQDEADAVCGVANAVLNHPLASNLLKTGVAEHSFYYDDPDTGMRLKVRPDYFRDDGIIVDLKSSEDASYDGFQRQMYRYKYYLQAAFYHWVLSRIYGREMRYYCWLVVEKEPPYAVALYRADETCLELGEEEFRKGLQVIRRCRELDQWPGYCFNDDKRRYEVVDMSLPHHALRA